MAEQFKESRELLEGVNAITIACIQQFADGFQPTDLPVLVTKLMSDPKVVAACTGLAGLKTEFADMTAEKYAAAIKELTPPMADLVCGVIVALKQKAAQ